MNFFTDIGLTPEQFLIATWETIYVTFITFAISFLIAIPLAVILVIGDEEGIKPLSPILMQVLNFIINVLRSIPFLILVILVMPLTRLIMGVAVGTAAFIVPLIIASFPFITRLIEGSLREVDSNLIEAAQSMGATNFQIISKVLLPEARPSIINNATVSITTVLSYTAMAGILGGGGLGSIAINYGYYRYNFKALLISVILIVILVQVIQGIGTYLSRKSDKRLL